MHKSSRHVLVVAPPEDADMLAELLRPSGYAVVEAVLDDALHALSGLSGPALVLLDDPPRQGLGVFLGALRRARVGDLARTPVVLLADGETGRIDGISEVVTKPFVPPLLLEVVQRLFEGL